ncbi:AraC family transcriptional regulator [Antrihabitans cavernicola]|uniref:AraC family transcriptional regulator n=1 Tax=Antrihabitans cavernicola TaxID=2495913 RepID=A0A5A7S1S2_9NOCA|nr:AraC family transcriptional regulator [Spelaeibacter cavernicola]KAA0016525.1 AraC family transcriptional regulator [Spelaeibacter cavernicola]
MKPLARYASLANYVELTAALGVDSAALLRSAGLDPAGVRLQDRWVPASAVVDLLERTAAQTGRADLGLRLAELRRLSHLGPLSLVLREEPDVRSALQVLVRHENMYNEALHTRVTTMDGIASARVELDLGTVQPDNQSIDLAVGVLHGLLRALLGPEWRPLAVCFGHPEPADGTTARRMFPGSLRYDHDFNGVVLYEADLDRPNAMADPQLRAYIQQVLPPATDRQIDTVGRVRELIEMLLPTGRCSVEQIAISMGVDRRTVHRRLAADGATFTGVLDDARAELARHLVAGQRHSLGEVAELLGLSSPSNFSRWFLRRFGASPRQWRAQA